MRRTLLLPTIALLLTACGTSAATDQPTDTGDSPTPAVSEGTAVPSPAASPPEASPSPSPSPTTPRASDEQLAAAGVNEIGRIPVLEWHKIQDADGRWENSLATFRAQLTELYERGYRPIGIDEFISGRIDLPMGTSPVLLTFDDSYKEHMFFADDGQTPDPDSAVGIIEAMEADDPTWRSRATFSFYWPVPFRETDRDVIEAKFRYLVANGFDLSNHTYNHDNLRDMSDAEVVENLARAEAELAAIVPDYRVRSITLTQGIWPENPELAMAGEFEGFAYQHDIAFEVGYMPTRSPNHVEYDPRSVQRVQAYVPEFRKWLDWLDEEPGRRFVSDGDPDTVTYPASFSEVASPQAGLATRVYDLDPAYATFTVPEAHCHGDGAPGDPTPCPSPTVATE